MSETEELPEYDPEEHLEANLSELSSDEIAALNDEAAAEHGEAADFAVEDEPLEEEYLLSEVEGGGS